jgi:hypothetical protein
MSRSTAFNHPVLVNKNVKFVNKNVKAAKNDLSASNYRKKGITKYAAKRAVCVKRTYLWILI